MRLDLCAKAPPIRMPDMPCFSWQSHDPQTQFAVAHEACHTPNAYVAHFGCRPQLRNKLELGKTGLPAMQRFSAALPDRHPAPRLALPAVRRPWRRRPPPCWTAPAGRTACRRLSPIALITVTKPKLKPVPASGAASTRLKEVTYLQGVARRDTSQVARVRASTLAEHARTEPRLSKAHLRMAH